MSSKTYLGDGVYVTDDGYHILLTTEDGICTTNTIALDPDVWMNLLKWHHELINRRLKNAQDQAQKLQEDSSD